MPSEANGGTQSRKGASRLQELQEQLNHLENRNQTCMTRKHTSQVWRAPELQAQGGRELGGARWDQGAGPALGLRVSSASAFIFVTALR